MVEALVQNRWLLVLRGVLAIIFGVMAFIWPGITLISLIYIFAAYTLIDGILTIIWAFRNREVRDRWWLGLLEGIIDIAAGVIAFQFPTLAAVTLLFVVAAWAVITGLLEIITAVRLRREIENEWSLGLAGALSVILGVVLFLNPGAGLMGMVWVIGIWAVIFGILMIVLGIRLGRLARGTTGSSGGSRIYSG